MKKIICVLAFFVGVSAWAEKRCSEEGQYCTAFCVTTPRAKDSEVDSFRILSLLEVDGETPGELISKCTDLPGLQTLLINSYAPFRARLGQGEIEYEFLGEYTLATPDNTCIDAGEKPLKK